MNQVGPIKEEKDIQLIKEELLKKSYRDYLLFLFGINTGIRFSDLINLKFNQVIKDGKIVPSIQIKKVEYEINKITKECLKVFCSRLPNFSPDDYIFKSRKGNEPIDRSHAYRIISGAAIRVGINQKVGTQTLRKTFGYHYYMKYNDVEVLQKMFNHNSSKQTLDFIGVNFFREEPEKKELLL